MFFPNGLNHIGSWLYKQLFIGDGPGGWNNDKVNGMTVKDAISRWAIDGKVVHAVNDVNWSNPHCPSSLCYAISRRSSCGNSETNEKDCISLGCAWCPDTDADQNCINIVYWKNCIHQYHKTLKSIFKCGKIRINSVLP